MEVVESLIMTTEKNVKEYWLEVSREWLVERSEEKLAVRKVIVKGNIKKT